MYQRQKAMKKIISFFARNSIDNGREWALFAGAVDEDWVQHHRIFERLRNAYHHTDEYKAELLRLTVRVGVLAIYDDTTCASFFLYSALIAAFNERIDSPTMREENSKIIASLTLSGTRSNDDDHYMALTGLVESIEPITPIATSRDRDS